MNGENIDLINQVNAELNEIKDWIHPNQMHSNTKYLNAYAVIRSCGVIEVVFKMILFDHLSAGANKEAESFLEANILENSRNPRTGVMESLLSEINPDWKTKFITVITNEEKQALNSLVQLRNNFAHGRNNNASIQTIIKYFHHGVSVLKKLDSIVGFSETS